MDQGEDLIRVSPSGLRDFAFCERLYLYTRVMNLQPKTLVGPLERGTLFHACLAALYAGEDWKGPLREYKAKFDELGEEVKVVLGDIPGETFRTMRSYVYRYRELDSEWVLVCDPEGKPIIERKFSARIPGTPVVIRGRIDAVFEHKPTETIWVWDHKSTKSATAPMSEVKFGDIQGIIYSLMVKSLIFHNKRDVDGVLFNYLRSKPPAVPVLLKSGKALSRAKSIDTDPYTFLLACKKYGFDPKDYKKEIRRLKGRPFFSRIKVPASDRLTKTILYEIATRAMRIKDTTYFTRTLQERFCNDCKMNPLCMAELFDQDINSVIAALYEQRGDFDEEAQEV